MNTTKGALQKEIAATTGISARTIQDYCTDKPEWAAEIRPLNNARNKIISLYDFFQEKINTHGLNMKNPFSEWVYDVNYNTQIESQKYPHAVIEDIRAYISEKKGNITDCIVRFFSYNLDATQQSMYIFNQVKRIEFRILVNPKFFLDEQDNERVDRSVKDIKEKSIRNPQKCISIYRSTQPFIYHGILIDNHLFMNHLYPESTSSSNTRMKYVEEGKHFEENSGDAFSAAQFHAFRNWFDYYWENMRDDKLL
jgi:hypothetical protein